MSFMKSINSNSKQKSHYMSGGFKSAFLILAFLCFSTSLFAQSFMVKGQVTDNKKEPLIGASIKEKNSKTATITDIDGNFTLTASSKNAILEVTYIGMKSQDVKINGKAELKIVLEDDSKVLDGLVVTALGIKREAKALGYATAEVKADEIVAGREANLMSALSGKFAGVDIASTSGGPSGTTSVIIRGISDINGNGPLYVIDGVPMDNSSKGDIGKAGGFDWGDGIGSLSPDDIENVSVLKGASAAALYGSRAANGVVLITTKTSNPKRKGIGVTYTTDLTIVKLLSNFDNYQRVYGQGNNGRPPMTVEEAQNTTMSAWGSKLDPNMDTYIYNGSKHNYGNKEDNVLSFFRTGAIYNNSVGFEGGGDRTSFRASISDMRNRDIVPTSDMSRTSFMIRGRSRLTDKLTIDSRVNYSYEKVNNRPALSDKSSNIGNSIIGLSPNFDQKWLSENYKNADGTYNTWNSEYLYRLNPYWVINEMSNVSRRNRVMGYMKLEYAISKSLQAHVRAGTDFYEFTTEVFTPRHTPGEENGALDLYDKSFKEDNYEMMLRYNKRLFDDKFDISAMVGGNIMRNKYTEITSRGTNQLGDGIRSITNYQTQTETRFRPTKQINSVFASANFAYDDYLYLDFTFRNDVSSTLPRSNRSYSYPSVSGSYVFSKHLDLERGLLSFGKLRASWAKVGKDTAPYQLDLSYAFVLPSFNSEIPGEIFGNAVPNKYLKPIQTFSYEFGTDLRFLRDRITLDFTYYNAVTKDQIIKLPISKTTGYNFQIINAGELSNKGIELAITGVPVRTRNFEWTAGVNLSRNWNKVESLHTEINEYTLSAARWGNAFLMATVGDAYGNIVGKGFLRSPEGEVIYKNGQPQFDSNVKVLGNSMYKLNMGIKQSFRYKDFSLSMLFDMKFGADMYSMTASQAHKYGTAKQTLEGRDEWARSERERIAQGVESDKWTPTGGYIGKGVKNIGTDANPEYVANDVPINPQSYWQLLAENVAEPFIYNASFIKLREMNFSYTINPKKLVKTPFHAVTVSVFGRNLWTIHKNVDNIDPEASYNTGNNRGFEYGSLPSRRSFGVGLNVKF